MSNRYKPVIASVPHILHGADYNPEQWIKMKDTIWPQDMRLAKEAGINVLSIGIFSWSMLEPEEDVYDFSWLDEVMDLLAENGMKANLATPSGARPVWMAKKHPEVLRIERNGVRNEFGGRHNACLSSPYFREKVTKINTLLAERYKDHPALGMWHISNEYGGSGDSACYCPYCKERFRDFLKARYGTIDALNDAWWTTFWSHRFDDFSQIEPPTERGDMNLHGLNLDWHRFTTWQYVDFYELETAPLKKITPDKPCTANLMRWFKPINYFQLADQLDVVSWDNYPLWKNTREDASVAMETAFMHDLFRSLKKGKPFLLMESCPSAVNWQPVSKIYAPGAHLSHSMQAVAHGSDSVMYFQFRKSRGSSEKFHGAVVDHEGQGKTRIFKEICQTGKALSGLDEIVGTTYPARAAVLFDWENWWAYDDAQFAHNDHKNYQEMVLEYYEAFYRLGIPVDIIDETCDLEKYQLVVTPLMYMLRNGFEKKIEQFVKNGGTWVTSCITGYVNDTDLCFLGGFPGPLKETLGIWEEELDSLYPEQYNEIEWNRKVYPAHFYCGLAHILDPEEAAGTKAEVLGRYLHDFYAGYPAVTAHAYGEGKAIYLAARMKKDFYLDFFKDLCIRLGLKPVLDQIPEGVEATVRSDGKQTYLFLNNFYPEPVQVSLLADGGVYYDHYSLLDGSLVSGRITLPPKGIQILKRTLRDAGTERISL
ncbi:MAG: beta-galactosidase [Firmicutes bacterium]|nr:beta-galactosidase [Bacillota bacterium]